MALLNRNILDIFLSALTEVLTLTVFEKQANPVNDFLPEGAKGYPVCNEMYN
jgi:hypothetical protein